MAVEFLLALPGSSLHWRMDGTNRYVLKAEGPNCHSSFTLDQFMLQMSNSPRDMILEGLRVITTEVLRAEAARR
jgi:hypothetical protein